MAALSCEICGGKLISKANGIFECDSCGMQYDKSRIQEMVQEIKGTVNVEGTVEVSGAVEIKGQATKDSLLKRGKIALADEKWTEAEKCFDKVLSIDPTCARAYVGLVFVNYEITSLIEAFEYEGWRELPEDSNYRKAIKYSDQALRSELDAFQHKWLEESYILACELQDSKKYEEAQQVLLTIKGYRNASELLIECQHLQNKQRESFYRIAKQAAKMIAAGKKHILGLRVDGSVLAIGENIFGQCDVQEWTNIMEVDTTDRYSIGLKFNGSIVATKYFEQRYDMTPLTDIVGISAGGEHVVGLRADGTVVAVGKNDYGQCDVQGWSDIISISAGYRHTVGLKSNGTVVAVGSGAFGECDVQTWESIVGISAGSSSTIGIRGDGTIVGSSHAPTYKERSDVIAVSYNNGAYLCLKSDRTAVISGVYAQNSWLHNQKLKIAQDYLVSGVVAGSSLEHGAVLLRPDGTLLPQGLDSSLDSQLKDWKLFDHVDTLETEREMYQQKNIRITTQLFKEREDIQTELTNLKGFFSGKRRKEIEARLTEIEAELKELG